MYKKYLKSYVRVLYEVTRKEMLIMVKVDYKKTFKKLYIPGTSPEIIEVPPFRFALIDGEGDPNLSEFAEATGALYSFSYSVKMSYKSKDVPLGYYNYTVFPLEGVWDLVDKNKSIDDKSNYKYSIMIRQPDFLTDELFERFISESKKKKPGICFDNIRYITITEGECCQMMHLGSYESERESFDIMENYCRNEGYERVQMTHREIYLSDPRKTELEKLKTVLRFKVRRKEHDSSNLGSPRTDTIESYIASQPQDIQDMLNTIKNTISEAIPDAEQRISWRMPTFWKKHNIIHFAAFKKHIGLYPGDKAILHFAEELKTYKTSKGAIQFPYDKPIPLELIAEIAKWCYETLGR